MQAHFARAEPWVPLLHGYLSDLSPVTGPVWTPKNHHNDLAQSQCDATLCQQSFFIPSSTSTTNHTLPSLRFDKEHKSCRFPTHCIMHAYMHLGHRLRPRCSCWLVPRDGLLLLLLPPPPPWSCTYASSALLSASASSPTSGS